MLRERPRDTRIQGAGAEVKRLSMSQCPACARENPTAALTCSACGTPLVMRCPACDAINVRTRHRCHHCAAALDPNLPPQAVPVDGSEDRPEVVPVLGPDDETVPDDWTLSLRADALATTSPATLPPALESREGWPTLDPLEPEVEVVADDAPIAAPNAAPNAAPIAAPMAPPPAPPASPRQDLDERRARRRAAVRRAVNRRKGVASTPPMRDVLVLEADPGTRAELCRTLESFGFRPHVAVSAAEAEGLSLRQSHVAAFLGIGSDCDGEDTESLCRRLHDAPRGRPVALIAIGDRRRHADRIRMQLAGADQVLFRPVGRGDLARALDDCGLRLPDDPRGTNDGP